MTKWHLIDAAVDVLVLHLLLLKEFFLGRTHAELVNHNFILQIVHLEVGSIFSCLYGEKAIVHLCDSNHLNSRLQVFLWEVSQRLGIRVNVVSLHPGLLLSILCWENLDELYKVISVADEKLHVMQFTIAVK